MEIDTYVITCVLRDVSTAINLSSDYSSPHETAKNGFWFNIPEDSVGMKGKIIDTLYYQNQSF